MSEVFLGEIVIFSGNFAPRYYAYCNNQILPIQQYSALFSLLGTTYGGNGSSNFALPDLRSRVPVSVGTGPGLSSYVQGQLSGTETVSLLQTQIPAHTHAIRATTNTGSLPAPTISSLPATPVNTGGAASLYSTGGTPTAMAAGAMGATGGGLPHSNVMPYLAVNFIIALQGIFPSRN